MDKIKFSILFSVAFFSMGWANQNVSGLQSGTWKAENNVYVVTGDITVPRGLSLIVQEGVLVKFAGDHTFAVDGDLIVQGTQARPVVFTSIADDQTGGDTNQDGIESGASPLDWNGIQIRSDYSRSSLRNLHISYSVTPLTIQTANLTIDSLFLEGNSTNQITIGTENIMIAEKTAFSRKAVQAKPAAVPENQSKSPSPWYKKPLALGTTAVVAAGGVAAYVILSGEKDRERITTAIPDPPGTPAD